MFALGLREGLEAALIVMTIATILRESGHLRRLLAAVAAAVALCAVIVVGVRGAQTLIDDTARHAVKAVVAAVAVVALTSTARWVVNYTRAAEPAPILPAAANGLVLSAFLAVLREGLELAVLPAATATDRWAQGTPAMLAGVVVAALVGVSGYLLGRRAPDGTATWTALALVLMAAGLATGVVRSSQVALGTGADVFVEIGWLAALPDWSARLLRGLFGWHATPSTAEVVAYGAYALAAALLLTRPTPPATRLDAREPRDAMGAGA